MSDVRFPVTRSKTKSTTRVFFVFCPPGRESHVAPTLRRSSQDTLGFLTLLRSFFLHGRLSISRPLSIQFLVDEQNKKYSQRIFLILSARKGISRRTHLFIKDENFLKPFGFNISSTGDLRFPDPIQFDSFADENKTKNIMRVFLFYVRPEGIEPSTISLRGSCSTS